MRRTFLFFTMVQWFIKVEKSYLFLLVINFKKKNDLSEHKSLIFNFISGLLSLLSDILMKHWLVRARPECRTYLFSCFK